MASYIETERLILRDWQESDLEPFAALNQDARVMDFFPSLRSYKESIDSMQKMDGHIAEHGFGPFAVSLKTTGEFIGFIGIMVVDLDVPFAPAVEIGWRLAFEYWGKGYATEGAKAVLKYGFEKVNLSEIVSFTVPANRRSRHVMEKIGMHRDPKDDFDHPKIAMGNPLRKHVLYRLSKEEWDKAAKI